MIRNPIAESAAAGIFLLLSCAPASDITVSNVHDLASLSGNQIIYALPMTVIDLEVTAEEVEIIAGPYAMYGEKYLGIKNCPMVNETWWNLADLRISTHHEADPEYMYASNLLQDPEKYPYLDQLVKDSLILLPGSFTSDIVFARSLPYEMQEIPFTDLSTEQNVDSESGRLKTTEQRAAEAAEFILNLRNERYYLVAGMNDYMPEGIALREAISELNRLEASYLSLFAGKRVAKTHVRSFHYVPSSQRETERVVLFAFSGREGFLEAGENGGKPVVMEITNNNKTEGLEQGVTALKTDNEMLYRIPDLATVRVLLGEEQVADANLRLFQYGTVVRMTVD